MSITRTNFVLPMLLVTLFFTALMPTLTLADIAPDLPEPNVNNIWYKNRNKDAVIVFVHGILSDSRDAWAHKGNDGSIVYWPKLLQNDPTFEDYSIFLGGFHTETDSRNFGMWDAATELFESLRYRQQDNIKSVLDHSSIIFVTHSTGGIVVRHMLVRNKSAFRTKKIGLLLIASPSLGSKYADLVTTVLDIVDHQMGKELRKESGILVELDKNFFNMVSKRELPGLIGREAFEHYFLEDSLFKYFVPDFLLKYFLEEVSVNSRARYFAEPLKIPNTDHSSVVKPHSTDDHLAYKFLSNFVTHEFKKWPHPQCKSPNGFKLKFSVTDRADTPSEARFDNLKNPHPILMLQTNKPIREDQVQALARQNNGSYEYSIKLPCVGQKFKAQFTRRVFDSELDKGERRLITDLCFKRNKLGLDLKFTHHECVEGGKCTPGPFDPGIAQACDIVDRGFPDKERWIIPSLETLRSLPPKKKPGFTVFTLQSDPLPQFEKADRFVASIVVNGVSVLEDGWPSGSVSEPYDNQEGLRFSFALQNLGFSGANDGKEIIEVSLRFFLGNILVGEETLTREYVALRDAKTLQLQLNNDSLVEWTGKYHSPLEPDKFEIFLKSHKDVTVAKNFKTRFDKAALTFRKQPLVAVIRPPLPPNKSFGVATGIVLENGQTRFTYSKQYADDLCRYLYSNRKSEKFRALIQEDIYRYENKPRAPGSLKSQPCKNLQ